MSTVMECHPIIITFPPPVPLKSKQLLEIYRQRNMNRSLYENVDVHRHNEIGKTEESFATSGDYDLVQFKTRVTEADNSEEVIHYYQDHEKQNDTINFNKSQLQSELEFVLKAKQQNEASINHSVTCEEVHSENVCQYGNVMQVSNYYSSKIETKPFVTKRSSSCESLTYMVHRPVHGELENSQNSLDKFASCSSSDVGDGAGDLAHEQQHEFQSDSEFYDDSAEVEVENSEIFKVEQLHIQDRNIRKQRSNLNSSGSPIFSKRPEVEGTSDQEDQEQDSFPIEIVPEIHIIEPSSSSNNKTEIEENNSSFLYPQIPSTSASGQLKNTKAKPPPITPRKIFPSSAASIIRRNSEGLTNIKIGSPSPLQLKEKVSFVKNIRKNQPKMLSSPELGTISTSSSPLKIHHVINLPPRKVQFIKKRRRKMYEDLSFQKSARLSQHMITEYKTTNTDNRRPNPLALYGNSHPVAVATSCSASAIGRHNTRNTLLSSSKLQLFDTCKHSASAVGRNMKKRIESWYQEHRIKIPTVNSGLINFHSKSRGGANFTEADNGKKLYNSGVSAESSTITPVLITETRSTRSEMGESRADENFADDFDETDPAAVEPADYIREGARDDEVEVRHHQGEQTQFRAHETIQQGQNEFEDLRKLVKQGGDFCKDLAAVLQERSELESQYAKGLSKLSVKLLKASKEATGSVAHAWQAVAVQIDTQAELHRLWSSALLDEIAKPLRNSTETQHKIRKSVETLVDKTTRNLAEWRTAETKAKRQCFSNSKEFEKLQESSSALTTMLSTTNLGPNGNNSLALTLPANNNGTASSMSNHSSVLAEVRARSRILSVPPTDKDPIKMETKRRKAEEAVRRADIEYYTFCVRAERARLEWEGSIRNGSKCLRTLEEEKLLLLKELALKYFQHFNEFIPKLVRSAESLEEPIRNQDIHQDMHSIVDIRRHAGVEQLLPDFYAEDTSNLMQKDRRKEALQKFVYLIKQDLEREKKGSIGIENLAKAIAEATKVDNAHHDISDKVYYMKSMLVYLEGAHYKIENVIADLEGRQRSSNPITQYMRYQRDKQGLPQTILKVPSWARDECISSSTNGDSVGSNSPDWHECDRGAGDGTSKSHDTDFEDEFSSEGSGEHIEEVFEEVTKASNLVNAPSIGRCRVIYDYESNMFDELTIRNGEIINVHDKQEDGWWLGELNGVIGIFPATYVEEVGEETAATNLITKSEIRV